MSPTEATTFKAICCFSRAVSLEVLIEMSGGALGACLCRCQPTESRLSRVFGKKVSERNQRFRQKKKKKKKSKYLLELA
jgi:hypothetical protein